MTAPAAARTAYDVVGYPSGVFATTHPDHLATVARLHGLTPPAVETARVLEIGGGDGMNLIAMAEALPRARLLGIELSEAQVARGRAIAAAAGLGNVRIEAGDILDAAHTLGGSFDYVIAHGVYAWVPRPVREAVMALIGRVLAQDGVAFVSYNALPGGHFRRILREMTLYAVGGIADLRERAAAARSFLQEFSAPREEDPPTLAALREIAAAVSAKAAALLLHDELSEVYEPQAFSEVVAAAAAHGLRFLNEAEPGRLAEGMPEAALDDAALVRSVQSGDHRQLCSFHQTLFVRDGCVPARSPDLDRLRDCYISLQCERDGATGFRSPAGSFAISDRALADAVGMAAAAWPRRLRVGDLVDDPLRLHAIYRLFRGTAIELHSIPLPGTAVPGHRPRASGLARALIARGEEKLFTLDHRPILFSDPAARAFLALLDGSRDRAALEAAWAVSGFAGAASVDEALARLAALPLMLD